MDPIEELLPGVWALRLTQHTDDRGSFVKCFHASALEALGLPFVLREQFVTRSARDVIRGMHFQVPPHDHVKLVTCIQGQVQDVVTDLRPGDGYGRTKSIVLTSEAPMLLYLPSGIAHGFRACSDDAVMLYMTSTEHAPEHDRGLLWSSVGHDWQCEAPRLSQRDRSHPSLSEFVTPFAPCGRTR